MAEPTKTITVKGMGLQEEAIAHEIIKPGMLIQVLSTGKVRKHATAGANAEKIVAIEDEMQGKDIDDTYAADARVQYKVFRRGEWFLGILKDGETIVVGDPLESGSGGELQKHIPDDSTSTNYTDQIVGYAMQALDMSDSSAADPSPRIKVRAA